MIKSLFKAKVSHNLHLKIVTIKDSLKPDRLSVVACCKIVSIDIMIFSLYFYNLFLFDKLNITFCIICTTSNILMTIHARVIYTCLLSIVIEITFCFNIDSIELTFKISSCNATFETISISSFP